MAFRKIGHIDYRGLGLGAHVWRGDLRATPVSSRHGGSSGSSQRRGSRGSSRCSRRSGSSRSRPESRQTQQSKQPFSLRGSVAILVVPCNIPSMKIPQLQLFCCEFHFIASCHHIAFTCLNFKFQIISNSNCFTLGLLQFSNKSFQIKQFNQY